MRHVLKTAFVSLTILSSPQIWAQTSAKQSIVPRATMAAAASQAFYAARADKTAWSNNRQYDDLIRAVEKLSEHGMDPEHYQLSALKSMRGDVKARDPIATSAWLTAATHMVYGKINPVTVEPDWTVAGRNLNLAESLASVLERGDMSKSLERLAPTQPGYKVLREEYARMKISADVPTTQITAGETLKSGMSGARVTLLQKRLTELDFLAELQLTGKMDADTVAAVKAFQLASELDDDGVVGPATLNTLNRNMAGQLNQLRVNMERWRWLPEDLGRRHLRANIAGFDVSAWNNGKRERTHLTIVGKTYRKTPVFSDEVEYAVFNPWWETPTSIMLRDKLPAFRKDPLAVERMGFQIIDKTGAVIAPSTIDWNDVSASAFPYRIRQAPGDANALGKVKIMFPNSHNVYLHDTPTRGLFAQRQRAFSSGCLRTQDPIELSKWLFEETPEWTSERIDAAVASGKETRANLASKVPVHILYFTVVSDDSGAVRYLDDIYARDKAVLDALNASPR